MPSHSFHYERRSVGSRGYAESPAAWRDPVAFENGTRLDTSTVVFASYARNKVQRWCAICAIIRWILISACQFLFERSSDAGSGSIVGPVLMEKRSAYGVACSSSIWKRAQWPVRHTPARIPCWTLSVGKHVVKHVTPVHRLQLLIRDKTLVRSLLNIQQCTYGANTSQTSSPLAMEFLRDIRGMQAKSLFGLVRGRRKRQRVCKPDKRNHHEEHTSVVATTEPRYGVCLRVRFVFLRSLYGSCRVARLSDALA